MITHIWSVLCQRSIVDPQSNNVSIIDVFEALEVDINPAPNINIQDNPEFNVPVNYQVVSLWARADEKKVVGQLRITLIGPNDKKRILVDKELTFPDDKRRMRTINEIQGLPVNKSGNYHFIVEIKQGEKFQKEADLPLEVRLNININTTPKQA